MTEGRIEPAGEGKCGVQQQVERRAGRPEKPKQPLAEAARRKR